MLKLRVRAILTVMINAGLLVLIGGLINHFIAKQIAYANPNDLDIQRRFGSHSIDIGAILVFIVLLYIIYRLTLIISKGRISLLWICIFTGLEGAALAYLIVQMTGFGALNKVTDPGLLMGLLTMLIIGLLLPLTENIINKALEKVIG